MKRKDALSVVCVLNVKSVLQFISKNLSETPDSTTISNRRIRSKIELSNETKELIPDILRLYTSLILQNNEVKTPPKSTK